MTGILQVIVMIIQRVILIHLVLAHVLGKTVFIIAIGNVYNMRG